MPKCDEAISVYTECNGKNVQYEIEQIENEIAKRELDSQKEKTKNDDSHIFKSFKSDLKDYKK